MHQLNTFGHQATVWLQNTWHTIKEDERGEGLVSFLIIAVAVAVLALFSLGVFETEVEEQIGNLDLGGDPPEPEDPSGR